MHDETSAFGDVYQLQSRQVGQALIAQHEIEGGFALRHQLDRLFSVFSQRQLVEAKALEQALGGKALKGVILHHQESKVGLEHRMGTR